LLQDPKAWQDTIVTHLRQMWDQHLAAEWERTSAVVRDSVAAFETLDFTSNSNAETVCRIIRRDGVPDPWKSRLPDVEHLVFIPSPHIGPYVILMDRTGTTARIAFGARIPKGASVESPTLSRSELIVRLSALADDTRLHILDLLAHEDGLRAQDIIDRLGINQSSASRHLSQLAATGYLTVQRCEGAKCYSLKRDRIDDTLGDLKRFLGVG
jgi:DNA-binding transcriptional ArsR family regulator